jgi:hypothetical protein
MGEGMSFGGGRAHCPRCGDFMPWQGESRCPHAVAVLLEDANGVVAPVCASHASHPSVSSWKRKSLRRETQVNP